MPIFLATPLAPAVVAFALLLVLWATQTLLVRPLTQLLAYVPVIGGTVAQAISSVVGTVIQWAFSWVGKAVSGVVEILSAPIIWLGNLFSGLIATLELLAGKVAVVAANAAGAFGQVADRIASLVAQVSGLGALITGLRSALASLADRIAAVIAHTIPDAIATVRAWASSLVASAVATAARALSAAIATVRDWALGIVAAAVAQLTSALATVRTFLLSAIAAAVKPIAAELDALGRALSAAVAAVAVRVTALEKLLPLSLLVPLVTAIPTTIEQFWRTKNECVDPTCNLLGDTLNGLGSVGQLLTGSVLLVLVEQAIANPAGTADEVAGWAPELRGLASQVTEALAGRSL